MAQCQDCKKFCGFDVEVEADDEQINDTTLDVSLRLTLNSNCCSSPVKETTFDLSAELTEEHDCPKAEDALADGADWFELSSSVECEGDERTQDTEQYTTKRTKEVKTRVIPFRFRRKYYIGRATADVQCNKCGESFTVVLSDEIQASAMDDA